MNTDKNNTQLPQSSVSGCYVGTQTPIERLRNKLSPFITIVELLDGKDVVLSPFIEHTRTEERKNEMFERLLKTCAEYKNDIKIYLSDCEVFYSKNESNDMLQWCYNYIQKQKDSDEKKAIISELKNRGCL